MSSPFVAEIAMFAFNFPPIGWASCQGQLLPISQNTALFSLLGTMYGGDGKSTFALPNLQDQTVVGSGQGAGLSDYLQGETIGSANITLITSEMPAHNHFFNATTDRGNTASANNTVPATGAAGPPNQAISGFVYSATAPNNQLNAFALGVTGSSFPHNNMQPYLTLNFCIAMQGVFPPRT
jgi:microcystin-dependent protein